MDIRFEYCLSIRKEQSQEARIETQQRLSRANFPGVADALLG
jgi:hypothetical protein